MRRYGATPARRRDLRQQQTDAEAKLWCFLKSRHLDGFTFRRQHSVGPYILDFFTGDHLLTDPLVVLDEIL
jgi:very-short-patch-repair endonuclease